MKQCPQCGNKLKVDHYTQKHPSGHVLHLSRLICSSNCGYKKEFPVPTQLNESEDY